MRKSIAGATVAAVILSACGATSSGSVAATVDDTDITVDEVRGFTFEQASTLDSMTFTQYLNYLIQWTVLEQAAADEFGIAPTDEETQAEVQRLMQEAGAASIAEFAESNQLSEAVVTRLARLGLIEEELSENLPGAEPSAEEVAAAVAEERVNLTEVCVRHLLVATDEEAQEAMTRIDGGEEFAAVAEEVSTDTASGAAGGDLECSPAQRYVPEFRDAAVAAEIDAITGPVATEFGYHVLQVYERTEPDETTLSSEEEIRAGLQEQAGVTALQDWLVDKVSTATVTVEEEFGTWTLEPTPQVLPPAG